MHFLLEVIAKFFRKITKSIAVNISESTNEYYRKIISKSGRKMDLYPALFEMKGGNHILK